MTSTAKRHLVSFVFVLSTLWPAAVHAQTADVYGVVTVSPANASPSPTSLLSVR